MTRLVKHLKPSFAVLFLLLMGCASPITMNKTQHIEQGITSDGLSSMVERKPTKVLMVFDPENGNEYQIQVFLMQTDTIMTTTYTKYKRGSDLLLTHVLQYCNKGSCPDR